MLYTSCSPRSARSETPPSRSRPPTPPTRASPLKRAHTMNPSSSPTSPAPAPLTSSPKSSPGCRRRLPELKTSYSESNIMPGVRGPPPLVDNKVTTTAASFQQIQAAAAVGNTFHGSMATGSSSTLPIVRSRARQSISPEMRVPDTPPSPMPIPTGQMIGLGLDRLHELDEQALNASAFIPPSIQSSAERQLSKLMCLPMEMSDALNRLCSQHYSSEYNVLKRQVANLIQQPVEPTQILLSEPRRAQSPLPKEINSLQRSYSSPVLHVGPGLVQTETQPESVQESVHRVHSATSHWVAPARPASSRGDVRPVFCSASSGISIPSTPPSHALAANHVPLAPHTSTLTPTMLDFGFNFDFPNNACGKKPVDVVNKGLTLERPFTDDIAELAREALATDFEQPATESGVIASQPDGSELSHSTTVTLKTLPEEPFVAGVQLMNGQVVKTSVSHPMNISALIPFETLPLVSAGVFGCNKGSSGSLKVTPSRSPLMPSASILTNSPSLEHRRPFYLDTGRMSDLHTILSGDVVPGPMTPSMMMTKMKMTTGTETGQSARLIGNFMLSSCPGKKVRLNETNNLNVGPPGVNKSGRSAICRDLTTDLARAKGEGVRLVICCLGDQELEYLGAPWPEYAHSADSLGLAVVRLPMVEGFAPTSPAMLDYHLSHIIKNYTLKGSSVLAHCRGGIGRAGLVACCWLIKMGLITVPPSPSSFNEGESEEGRTSCLDADPMSIVVRVIEVIRRRRSVKSIETGPQVHFLWEYVVFLQNQAKMMRSVDLVG